MREASHGVTAGGKQNFLTLFMTGANLSSAPTVTVGGVADITVFRVEKGEYGFMDVRKTRIKGDRRIVTEITLRAGKVVWDLNGLSAPLWQSELPGKK